MKKFLKSTIIKILLRLSQPLEERAPILMYHSVGKNKAFFTVQSEEFERQLIYINERFVTAFISELLGAESIKGRAALSFDDAYEDFYHNVFPLLKKYKMKATLFVPTGLVGKEYQTSDGIRLPIMSWEQIEEVEKSGLVECMPHTDTHQQLNRAKTELIEKELKNSRTMLEKKLGGTRDILAYPRGMFDEEVVKVLRQNQWRAAVTVRRGLYSTQSDRYRIGRNAIDSFTSWEEFQLKLSSGIESYKKFRNYL